MLQLTQPFLIERITTLLGIADGKTNEKLTPVGKPLLNKDLFGVPRKYDWEYRGAIGMHTYLTGSVRPDIAMATHQCARFSINPMRLHEQAVMRIGRYLLSTKEKGMIYRPDSSREVEVFVDADFAGGWDPEDALNADSVYSRTVMLFAMLDVQFIGRASFKRRLHFQLQRLSILRYRRL